MGLSDEDHHSQHTTAAIVAGTAAAVAGALASAARLGHEVGAARREPSRPTISVVASTAPYSLAKRRGGL